MSLSLFLNLLVLLLLLALLFLSWRLLRAFSARATAETDVVLQLTQTFQNGLERLSRQLQELYRQEAAQARRELAETLDRLGEAQSRSAAQLLQTLQHTLAQQSEGASRHLSELGAAQGVRLEDFSRTLTQVTQGLDARFGQLRASVEERLQDLQRDNAAKLEQMRATVDEKLHATLEQRLGESFKLVSQHLENVQRGLGEMRTLATGVGDLKRVLANVKTRGVWGEVQLAQLLEQMLTPSQYATNVATRPGSAERVEFAIALPGPTPEKGPVWLPIDAKFPLEDYQRLQEAQELGDAAAVEAAARALETRLKQEAKSIREKYVSPPDTTDFALLYLPLEGLYAEALRRPGLADTLQRQWRINLAGPTTLSALLNSLQMGFRTLAIEQRSAEVWTVLGAVKTEFGKFGEALAHTKKKLSEAASSIEKAETRTRQLSRTLKNVEALPVIDSEPMPELTSDSD